MKKVELQGFAQGIILAPGYLFASNTRCRNYFRLNAAMPWAKPIGRWSDWDSWPVNRRLMRKPRAKGKLNSPRHHCDPWPFGGITKLIFPNGHQMKFLFVDIKSKA